MKAGALNGNCDWFLLVVFHLLWSSMMTKINLIHESKFGSWNFLCLHLFCLNPNNSHFFWSRLARKHDWFLQFDVFFFVPGFLFCARKNCCFVWRTRKRCFSKKADALIWQCDFVSFGYIVFAFVTRGIGKRKVVYCAFFYLSDFYW